MTNKRPIPDHIVHPDAIDVREDPTMCGRATYDAVRGPTEELVNIADEAAANTRCRRHREIMRHLYPIVDELAHAWLEDRGWTPDQTVQDPVSTSVILRNVESALWHHLRAAINAAPAAMWRADKRLAPREQRHLDHDEALDREWDTLQHPEVRS